jgi:hypothetical protein
MDKSWKRPKRVLIELSEGTISVALSHVTVVQSRVTFMR